MTNYLLIWMMKKKIGWGRNVGNCSGEWAKGRWGEWETERLRDWGTERWVMSGEWWVGSGEWWVGRDWCRLNKIDERLMWIDGIMEWWNVAGCWLLVAGCRLQVWKVGSFEVLHNFVNHFYETSFCSLFGVLCFWSGWLGLLNLFDRRKRFWSLKSPSGATLW